MLITLRLPSSSALRLGLPGADVDHEDVVAVLSVVELAGRLSLAGGKAISPEAVLKYCNAWQAARDMLGGLVQEYGQETLSELFREACGKRSLWVPPQDESIEGWLKCVLEAHFLSAKEGVKVKTRGDWATTAAEGANALAELCQLNFPLAYSLWATEEASGTIVVPGASAIDVARCEARS